jgi:glycosyltransferase involved in cell wall biosynthesis
LPYNGKKVSVVLPAYNEEISVGKVVSDFLSKPCVDEVIVVDNNSTDRTSEAAKRSGAKVVFEGKQK